MAEQRAASASAICPADLLPRVSLTERSSPSTKPITEPANVVNISTEGRVKISKGQAESRLKQLDRLPACPIQSVGCVTWQEMAVLTVEKSSYCYRYQISRITVLDRSLKLPPRVWTKVWVLPTLRATGKATTIPILEVLPKTPTSKMRPI